MESHSETLKAVPDAQLREVAETLYEIALDAARDDGARAHRFHIDLAEAVNDYTPPRWILPPALFPPFYQAFCQGWLEQHDDAEQFDRKAVS